MYVRYVTDKMDPTSHEPLGVFQLASELEDQLDLPIDVRDRIKQTCAWFDHNLPTPGRFSRSRRSNAAAKAISWFRTDAYECIERIRDLVSMLNKYGYGVREVTTDRPGYVVYEDKFQVVAEPFRGSD